MRKWLAFLILNILIFTLLSTGCDKKQYDLTININGGGDTTPNTGTYTYIDGTSVVVSAKAAPGWKFDGWSGDILETDSTVTVVMDGEKRITASFLKTTFLSLLNLIPNAAIGIQPEKNYIVIHDFAKIRQIYNIAIPTSTSDQEVGSYVTQILNLTTGAMPSGFISGFDQYALAGPIRNNNIGYDAYNVDAAIILPAIPPLSYQALIGRFSPSATQAVFDKQDGWDQSVRDNYKVEMYRDMPVYSWGDGNVLELKRTLKPPDCDFLGRARPVAITNTNVFYSHSTDSLKAMIDLSLGQATSVADMADYASLAEGLTTLGAYNAILGDDAIIGGENTLSAWDIRASTGDVSQAIAKAPSGVPLREYLLGQSPLLEPYSTFAIGIGTDDKGYYMAVVLVHENANNASSNINLLRTRIENVVLSDGSICKTKFTEIQLSNEGNMLLGKLYTKSSTLWSQFVNRNEIVFLHK